VLLHVLLLLLLLTVGVVVEGRTGHVVHRLGAGAKGRLRELRQHATNGKLNNLGSAAKIR